MTAATQRVGDVIVTTDDGVVSVTLDRPAAKNAINDAVLDGLAAAVQIAAQESARVLVVRGAGGTFCAGADLHEVERMCNDTARLTAFSTRLGELLDRIEVAPFASIAVVNGYAVAGGCELLLACDIVLAADTARIGDRHLEYGLLPAAGASVRLPRQLSAARANYLLLTGEMMTGREAAAWGLAAFSAPAAELDAMAASIAARVVGRSPAAIAAIKRLVSAGRRASYAEAQQLERSEFLRHMASPDAREGLAAFRERRMPTFTLSTTEVATTE